MDGADFQELQVPLTEEEVEAVNALTREELLAELRSENASMPQPSKRDKPDNREACAHLSQMLTSVTECSCMIQGSALRATIASCGYAEPGLQSLYSAQCAYALEGQHQTAGRLVYAAARLQHRLECNYAATCLTHQCAHVQPRGWRVRPPAPQHPQPLRAA